MNDLYNIVRNKFDYDEKTGLLIWKNSYFKSMNGTRAGSLKKSDGYRRISINGKDYREHRIIWLWKYGYLPENDIDHINRIRNDNRISNIREITPSCNAKNAKISSRNKTGITGVPEWNGKYKPFIINNKGKEIYLGTFNTLLNGSKTRYLAEVKYNYENCNSTSTAYQYVKDNDPEWLKDKTQIEKNKQNKSSGIKGISFHKTSNKWVSEIQINKKRIILGRFNELDDAVMIRYKAEVKYNQTENSQSYTYLKERNLI